MRILDPDAHAKVRRRILDAARSQFAAQGYHSASMNDVAKAAKLAKAAVYHYFPGKHAMLEALHQDMWAGAIAKLDALPRVKTLREALRTTGLGYLEHFREPQAAEMMLIAFNVAVEDPSLMELAEGMVVPPIEDRLVGFFRPYFAKGTSADAIHLHLMPFFGAIFHYLFVLCRICPSDKLPATAEAYLEHLVDVFAVVPRRTRSKR